MQSSMIHRAVLGALFAQAARKMDDPSEPTVGAVISDATARLQAKAQAPKVLNGTAIKVFFTGDQAEKDAAKVGTAEKNRLGYLLGLMFRTYTEAQADEHNAKAKDEAEMVKAGALYPIVDVATVKQAAQEYVKDIATEAGWKGGKGAGKAPRPVKVARSRAAEIKAIYGGIRFAGIVPEVGKVGYHDVVSKARESLEEKGIKPDGTKIPDAESRKLAQIGNREQSKVAAVGKAAAEKAKELGRALTEAEYQEIWAAAGEVYVKQSAVEIAGEIVKKHGVALAEQVAALLPQAIQDYIASEGKSAEPKLPQAKPKPEEK